ncbi:response regulator [Nostocoides sp. HKS02]|uniref:response regulator n=1 Tax=Nostocoides sp. HKS02 TaxID=1813880 RepID=UPI0012B4997B|nr:response regulator [Tetrasphaera sp. HKS02]QGN58066.1 response regulator [Tetrasphaera sp. HKS02]
MGAGVLVVDDDAQFRLTARRLLEAGGFSIVGEAADGAAALAAVRRLAPEVVLLDVQLPDMDGFEVCRRLALDGAPVVVILVSSRPATAYGGRLERSSARGFVAKEDLTGAAVRALLE